MADPQTKPKTFWFDHRTDLPAWLSIGIGQIVAEWAFVEKELEGLILVLTNGDFQQNRILLFKVNIWTRIAVIKALIESHILENRLSEADKEKFAIIAKKIEERQGERNLVAHGLWTKHGKSWKVLQTSGSRSIPELQPIIRKLARAVLPQRRKRHRRKNAFLLQDGSQDRKTDRSAVASHQQKPWADATNLAELHSAEA
jgi:hypothetical protein